MCPSRVQRDIKSWPMDIDNNVNCTSLFVTLYVNRWAKFARTHALPAAAQTSFTHFRDFFFFFLSKDTHFRDCFRDM